MEEELPEPSKDDMVRQLRGRRLLMAASALGENIDGLWDVYRELMSVMDLSNPDEYTMMLDIVAEFEDNLVEMLTKVDEQIFMLTGVYEVEPTDTVDDFEASILRTISGLDDVNLEDFRI